MSIRVNPNFINEDTDIKGFS